MLLDGYGRKVNYLRVSVTERCNFRCQYCMPEKPFSWVPKENLLSFEELFLFIKVGIDEGIDKIRITGGEPLLRKGLDQFIRMINDYKSGLDIALTTNGYLLSDIAQDLKDAGLKRINVSLDTLKDDVAHKISGKDVLKKVKEGIEKAREVGLGIKINNVPLKGVNAEELLDVLEYCKQRDMPIRFIEYMENQHAKEKLVGLNSNEIQEIVATKYNFQEVKRDTASPAQMFEFEDGYRFGIISPHKHDFCEDCNRIRLTAEGLLIPCLYFEEAMSIKKAVQSGDIGAAAEVLKEVLKNKPEKNKWSSDDNNETSSRAFYETGG
ncbi:GTP 3',8-cyclase MoaA [Sulfurospirillum arcachonense]|uniref:GTP 3',8-cyclase MoaA n=1 Tax=Sulfurospirillum arcachonense TaxID=57666 RepID=UPI00046AA274|nr:GTP 3',8-cyclase MoaA [Sulfurospirillum arcachonense]